MSTPNSTNNGTKTKSLLTPFRRIGLSRKTKTPTISKPIDNINNVIELNLTPDAKTPTDLKTTPNSNKKSSITSLLTPYRRIGLSRNVKSGSKVKDSVSNIIGSYETPKNEAIPIQNITPVEQDDRLKSKRRVKKCLLDEIEGCQLLDDRNKCDNGNGRCERVEITVKESECKDIVERKGKKRVRKALSNEDDGTKDIVLKESDKKDNQISKIKEQENCDTTDKQFSIVYCDQKAKKQKVKPKQPFVDDEDFLPTTNGKLKKLPSSSCDDKISISSKNTSKPIKRSLSLKKSSQDSSNESKTITKIDLENLRKIVRSKEEELENLKRAETYRKLHDLEELGRLTDVWKKGCVQALNVLLENLRLHGNIDFGVLMKNLGINRELLGLDFEI